MKISAREKKFIIAGAAGLALALLYAFSDQLLPSGEDLSRKVASKKQLLLRYRETLSEEESYKARLVQYRERLQQSEARLLPGENPSIAAAELQKALKDVTDQNGVELIRRDPQREQKLQDNLIKISVRIEMNCAPEQLVQFIAAVENYDKALTIDEMTINSFRLQKKIEIRPSLTVSGYLRGVETKPLEKPIGASRTG